MTLRVQSGDEAITRPRFLLYLDTPTILFELLLGGNKIHVKELKQYLTMSWAGLHGIPNFDNSIRCHCFFPIYTGLLLGQKGHIPGLCTEKDIRFFLKMQY